MEGEKEGKEEKTGKLTSPRPLHAPDWSLFTEDLARLPGRTIDEALRTQAARIPDAPFIKYMCEDGKHFDTYTYAGIFPAPPELIIPSKRIRDNLT